MTKEEVAAGGDMIKDIPMVKQGDNKEGSDAAEGTKASVIDLFRSKGLLRSTLILYYLFFTNSMVYYGLALNSGKLIPGNIHYNTIVSGVLEILSNLLPILAFLYVGR